MHGAHHHRLKLLGNSAANRVILVVVGWGCVAAVSVIALSGCGRFGFGSTDLDDANTTTREDASVEDASSSPDAPAVRCSTPADCIAGIVEPTYPQNGANWNDYVNYDMPSRDAYHQSDIACSASATAGRLSCLPAATMRKLRLTGTTCGGRTATDELDVFEWFCDDQDNQPTLYSRGFKPGRGLRDLIGPDMMWRPNRVIVSLDAATVESELSFWWQNPIVSLAGAAFQNGNPATDSMIDLATPGTVYVLPADQLSEGYRLIAHKVSIVTLPGATLRYAGSGNVNCTNSMGGADNRVCLISVPPGSAFVWIEGDFDANDGPAEQRGIYLNRTRFSRVHNARVSNATYGLRLNTSDSNVVTDVVASNNSNAGLVLDGSNYNVLSGLALSNNGAGIKHFNNESPSAFNTFDRIVATSNDCGVDYASAANNNVFTRITTANSGNGFAIDAHRATVHNLGSINCTTALRIRGNTSLASFSQLALGFGFQGVRMIAPAADTRFTGTAVIARHTGADCDIDAGTANPGITTSCMPAGTSAFTLTTTMVSPPGFVGKVGAPGDGVNVSDTDGIAAASSITDWHRFENSFRAWGLDGGAGFPLNAQRGLCANPDTCRIWDWRLLSSDPILRNRTGNGQTENTPLVSGQPCPAELHGDEVATDQHSTPNVYLLNAVERLLDHEGDEDGLCESNEACIYTPNFGAYQGHGAVRNSGCTFESGIVSNVTILAYDQNGIAP